LNVLEVVGTVHHARGRYVPTIRMLLRSASRVVWNDTSVSGTGLMVFLKGGGGAASTSSNSNFNKAGTVG